MDNLTNTNKHLLVMIVLDICLFLIGLFIWFDFQNNRLAEIDSLNIKLNARQEMKNGSNSMAKILKENKDKIDRLNLYFITKETVPNFIEELELIASHSGVSIKLDSLGVGIEEKQQSKPTFLKLSFKVKGNFSNIFYFLTILEKIPYQLRFNAVSLVKLEEDLDTDQPPWYSNINVDLISYIGK